MHLHLSNLSSIRHILARVAIVTFSRQHGPASGGAGKDFAFAIGVY